MTLFAVARQRDIEQLVEMEKLRANGDYAASDILRADLVSRGWIVSSGWPNVPNTDREDWQSARRVIERITAGGSRACREWVLEIVA